MRRLTVAMLIALSLHAGPLVAQTPATPAAAPVPVPVPVPVQTLGPQPGAKVPDFTASDQAGKVHTLKSLLGPKGAMLVFSRSADW